MLSPSSCTEEDILNLPTLFNQGLDIFNNLGTLDEPTNSFAVQCNVKKAIKTFERATILCTHAQIFSKNEGIKEVATSDLQYFLLPALLGSLHLKLTSGERRNIVEVSEVYFTDFLKRCVVYSLCKYDFKKDTFQGEMDENMSETSLSEVEELTVMAKRRAVKIARYKEQEELKKRLGELKNNMENEYADEEIKRNYFLTMIQMYIYEAIDELNSLEYEKELLNHIAKLKKIELSKPKKRPPPLLQPVIINTDFSKKNPPACSLLPTRTVEEFCGKNMKDGVFSETSKIKHYLLNSNGAALRCPFQDEVENYVNWEEEDTDDYHVLEAIRQINEKRRQSENKTNQSY